MSSLRFYRIGTSPAGKRIYEAGLRFQASQPPPAVSADAPRRSAESQDGRPGNIDRETALAMWALGMSSRQIARACRCAESSVRTIVARARSAGDPRAALRLPGPKPGCPIATPIEPQPSSSWHGPLRTIIEEVAARYGLPVEAMFSSGKIGGRGGRAPRLLSAIRHEAMFRCVAETALSLPIIGRAFGMDHTSIGHGVMRHAERNGLTPPRGMKWKPGKCRPLQTGKLSDISDGFRVAGEIFKIVVALECPLAAQEAVFAIMQREALKAEAIK